MDKQQPLTNLADFMALAPLEFIDQAYRTLLGREPDPAGRSHFLMALCTGVLDKAEILDALSKSPEGAGQGVVIAGLQKHLQRSRFLAGFPFVGRVLRLIRRIEQMPVLGQLVADLTYQQQVVQMQQQELAVQQQEYLRLFGEKHHRSEVRLGILEAGVNSIRLETRRTVAEYRRYLLALEPSALPVAVVQPSVSAQASSCAFSDSIYAGFEDEFRGSPEQVRQGLAPYLPLVLEAVRKHPALPVIDLGCGRGEWLELLTDEGVPVRGADLNPVVVASLVERGYDVTLSDVFVFLASQPDASAVAVTSFHLIEHLPSEQWLPLLDEIQRILVPGGLVIIETPNPRNILVGAGDFFRDPSHRTPVFPDTLAYFGRVRGFDDSRACFFDEGRTRLIPAEDWRFDALDDYVRVSRDYAWFGMKNI